METKKINYCRGCGSQDNFRHLNKFTNYPLFDDIVTKSRSGSEYLGDLDILICNKCNLLQNPKNINFEDYYDDYIYSASSSDHAKKYMKELVSLTLKKIESKSCRPKVIDIGSSDGSFLQFFKDQSCDVLGFEGSHNLAERSHQKNILTVNRLFSKDSAKDLNKYSFNDPDIICLLHTFDHLPNPSEFLLSIGSILGSGGYLLLEVHSLDKMIQQNEGAIFAHEHTCYYSELTLKNLLSSHNFKEIAYNYVDEKLMRGASQIILCQYVPDNAISLHKTDSIASSTIEFSVNLKRGNIAVAEYIKDKISSGHKIAGFGGWGRGVGSISQSCLTSKELTCVFDNNKFLHNCFIPGTKIPIYNPSKNNLDCIDEIIIFNYGYFNEIKKQVRFLTQKEIKITNVNQIRTNLKSI